ncbi:MAG: PD40 domain-containing protein [Cyanobacteria bacterium NC_groundwater_1444_Ag_S-0.65um_54_12]|nr:PD40 domain-containing protein [Cyanobacteria bacterium NC_groundwater_1444_Ag_S-0.65um_54_12]
MKYLWAILLILCGMFSALEPGSAATLVPPGSAWRTIETPHFRIHFPPELREIARRAAVMAEECHARLGPYFGRTEIITNVTILDTEDTTNGFATTFPETSLTFFVTPPSPDEEWYVGRYDNWLKMIIAHEYTHVLQAQVGSGPASIPGQLNAIAVRAFLPEFSPLLMLDFLPEFMKEGLAVFQESAISGGGRALEGAFDMIMRTDFRSGKLVSIDQASGKYPLDWAPGGAHYVYGTAFYRYLLSKYGDQAAVKLTQRLGEAPWLGINVAAWRSVGRTVYQLWEEMLSYFQERYQAQVAEISRLPLTIGKPVTTAGRNHRHPRWLPDGRLVYTRSPLEGSAGLVSSRPDGSDQRLLLAKSSRKDYSLTADGKAVYYYAEGTGPTLTAFYDIYRFYLESGKTQQLTHGLRASFPAISPSGDRILVVLNGSGRNDLGMLDRHGKLLWRFRGPDFGSFSSPTWSPDGKRIALAQWVDGRTQVMLFDPETRSIAPAAPEAAVQLYPAWSPDSRMLLFASDRTGVMNLHAVRLADGKRFRITNVLGGAFDPAVSPDGTQLAFAEYHGSGAEYHAVGYDIQLLPYQPATWLPEDTDGTVIDYRSGSEPFRSKAGGRWPVAASRGRDGSGTVQSDTDSETTVLDTLREQAYSPFPSLLPQNIWPRILLDQLNPGSLAALSNLPGIGANLRGGGPLLAIQAYGQDVLQQHSYFGTLGLMAGAMRTLYAFYYTNNQFEPSLSLGISAFPNVLLATPGTASLELLGREERTLSFGISYPPPPTPLLGNWLSGMVGHAEARFKSFLPFISIAGKNHEFPGIPLPLGNVLLPVRENSLTLSIFGNETERPFRAFSPVGGPLWTAGLERSDTLFGSDLGHTRAWFEGRYFLKAFDRQVLALRALGGANFVDPQLPNSNGAIYYNPDFFLLGDSVATSSPTFATGRSSSTIIHSLDDLRGLPSELESQVPLRGYASGVEIGRHVTLLSAEYRIPLWEVQRGIGTVPFFVERLSVAPFLDVGKAWTTWDSAPLLTGLGIETRAHVVLAQSIPSEFRLGYAKGLHPLGVHQLILGIGAVF